MPEPGLPGGAVELESPGGLAESPPIVGEEELEETLGVLMDGTVVVSKTALPGSFWEDMKICMESTSFG